MYSRAAPIVAAIAVVALGVVLAIANAPAPGGTPPPPTAHFDRDALVEYADAYSCTSTVRATCYNDEFINADSGFNGSGDCANFVSQALAAAGLTQADDWYYVASGDRSASWAGVPGFVAAMTARGATVTAVDDLGAQYSGAVAGDIYLIQLHGHGISHVALAVGDGEYADYTDPYSGVRFRADFDEGSMLDQHSMDLNHAPWNWSYLVAPDRSKIAIWIMHFEEA